MNTVQPTSFLTLHYRLAGADGQDIVNTFNDKPATLSMGTGELAPAMEAYLLGLHEGDHQSFELSAGEAFGQRNPAMLQWVARSLLSQWGDPADQYNVGDVVKFPTPDGQASYAGTVREMNGDLLLFDFNHPLAGQPVLFEVKLIGILE